MNKIQRHIRTLLLLLCLSVGWGNAWADTWDGTKSSTLSTKEGGTGAAGSATNPYLIQSAKDFAYLMIDKAGQNWYVELTTDLDMDGVNRTWTGGQNKTYKGHFEGNGHTISNVRVAFSAGGNYGVFGNVTGSSASNKAEVKNVKLDNITLECTSIVSFSYNGQTGAVAGQAKWSVIDNVTATDIKATYKANVGMTASNKIGGLLGYATDIVDVTNCTVDGYAIEIQGATTSLILGGLIGQTTNSGTNSSINVIGNTVKGAVMNITTKSTLTASAPNIGGLIGYVNSGATSGTPAKIYNNTIEKSTTEGKSYTGKSAEITINGLASGNFYVGGFIGQVVGKGSPNYRALVKANTVNDVVVSHTNATNAGYFRLGGFIGYVNQHCDILNNTVTRPQVTKQGAIKAITCVGGAIGYTTDYSVVDGLHVNGGSITGPTATAQINNSIVAAFGGVLGYKNASANTYNYQVSVFKNIVINNFNIDLGNYTSADGKIQNWKYFVGGVIGTLGDSRIGKEGTTSSMPENLVSKGVKIYAPLAVVSPLVAHFNTGAAVSYTNYFMQDKTTFDDFERSKVASWVYNDFKVGLSNSVQSNISNKLADYNAAYANGLTRRNYDAAQKETINSVDYISVDNLKKNNRIYDFETDSKTVLWWTKQDGSATSSNNDIEQNIYPSTGATATGNLTNTYPYWMYYYQGVNYGTRLEDTESNPQITNIINGIDANFTQAQSETPVTLTITDAQDKARGFDEHNLTVTACDEGSYTYNWYVDGESQAETGSTLSVKPDWKTGKSIIVNALDASSNIIASTSFTLKHGVLHTKTSYNLRTSEPQDLSTDYIGMSYTDRGTEANPYIIDCPEALRQWSYLSTYPNAWNFEGLVANGRTALHWNRAWFELSSDIDLGTGATAEERKATPGDFTPISHVATASNGYGTYNQNSIFCGHFDGKGFAIRNFKVTWAGGRYNADGNQYFGLFGAVGWGATSPTDPCVIQNLVIDNAQLVHDTNNTSFAYNNGQTTNKNNLCIGALAGVVSNHTTIQNVEVRSSKITDAGSSAYNLQGKIFSVGGMIGRVQTTAVSTNVGDLANNVSLKFLSSDCDIELTHAEYLSNTSAQQMRYFTIGGVVGSLKTTGAFATINMPEFAYYNGKINSPNAIVGPVFASVDFSGLGDGYNLYYQHYMAKTSEATQEIPNLYYGDYKIQDYSASTSVERTITDAYPEITCFYGSRTITPHYNTHLNNATFYTEDNYYGEYQGVNYGEYINTGGQKTNIEILFEEAMNAEGIEGYYLIFDGNQMQLVKSKPMKVSILDNTTDAAATTHTLKVVNNKGNEGYTYVWYSNGTQVSTADTYDAPIGTSPQLIYVVATETATSTTKNTEAIGLPRSITELSASYSPEKKKEVTAATVDFVVTPKYMISEEVQYDEGHSIPTGYTATYKWEEFTKGSVSEGTYTDATALEANKPHIVSIKDGSGNIVDKASWTYAMSIGTASGYTVTYEKTLSTVEETITTDQYTALSDTEKAKCLSNGNGTYTYTHDVEITYTPVKSGDKYHSSTSDSWNTLSNSTAELSGVDKNKIYRCTITATDGTWSDYVSNLESTSPCYALRDAYTKTLTYEIIVRLRDRKVVYLHPVNGTNTTADGVPVGSDTWAGVSNDKLGDKDHPVATWGKAYSLLDGDEGATWDDNVIVLVGKSDYQTTFGTGKISDRTGGVGGYFSNVSHYGLSNVFVRSNNDATYGDNEVDHPKYETYKAMIEKSPMGKNVTITGKWYKDDDETKELVNYNAVIESPQYCGRTGREFINFYGNTKIEHLTFRGYSGDYDAIFAHYHDLWFGEGLIMKNHVASTSDYGTIATVNTPRMQVFGGMTGDARFNNQYDAANGLMDGKIVESMPNGEKGFTITVRSGFYSIICSGSRQTSNVGLQGSPNRPIKCTIDVDIDQAWNLQDGHDKTMKDENSTTPYDIALILAGNHEGAMYADVDIKVKSGRIARIVNGSLGALRNTTFKYNGTTQNYPKNTYMGRANILLDPASSRFATKGESVDATNQRVLVTELYNGGVGRSLGSNGEIDMPSLGKNTFTMKGGTIGYPAVTTNWSTTALGNLKASTEVFPGVYGGGAGGMNGIGYGEAGDASHTKEQYLPYWTDANKNTVLYGNYSKFKEENAKNKFTIKCYNTDTKDYTYIDPLETSSEINIQGGQLGTAANPINIFGGGSGFTSTWFLKTDRTSYPCTQAGGMYGSSKDAVVTTVNISGGEIYGNVYGAGKGTDYYYTNYRSGQTPWGENTTQAGKYTSLGQTYGSVVTNISGNAIINGNVYGAGAGVADAKFVGTTTYTPLTETALLSGTATINISGNAQVLSYTNGDKTYGGNVYGGGMLAKVDGNTNVNISGNVHISGKVFGAAQGITNNTTSATSADQYISGTTEKYLLHTADNAKLFGIVKGNATLSVTNQTMIGSVVTTTGTPTISGNIYGGAESAITEGNTSVTINGGIIKDVYGGGLGSVDDSTVKASADVYGNTEVTVKKASYFTDNENPEKNDLVPHFIYGGGQNASIIGQKKTVGAESVMSGGTTNVNIRHGIAMDQTTVYGAGEGSNTQCENTIVKISKFSENSGLSYVYGGGNQGKVNVRTSVSIFGGLILHDVFGGGNKATVGTEKSDAENVKTWAENHGTSVSMENAKSTSTEDGTETEEISDAIVYGDVYGGGNEANVYGNTSIKVKSGNFGGEIFGGGKGVLKADNTFQTSADVTGNTNIEVNGSVVIWNKKWDSTNKKFIEWNGGSDDSNFFTSYTDGSKTYPVFINNHNVYGGGNKACTIGTYSSGTIVPETGVSTVTVKKGFCDKDLLSTDVWKNAYGDDTHPHFYVFGGGYGAYTKVDTTKVEVGVSMDGKVVETSETDQQLAKPMRKTAANQGGDNASIGVYDNSYGIPDYTVLGVVGGGYAGLVLHDSFVNFGGDTYTHRIFGGGYGQLAAYQSLPSDATVATSKTRENLGEVGGNAVVEVTGGKVYGDIFGGGAGVESAKIEGTLTDFPDMGRVHGTTSVTISGTTQVYGSVYGGGDVANVGTSPASTETAAEKTARYSAKPASSSLSAKGDIIDYTHSGAQSFVNVTGGSIFGKVFGGGNGKLRSEASDYTLLGRIEGNALVHVIDTKVDDETTNTPYIWNSIYGGGSYGTVDGNTLVHIEGGFLGYDIFGGGFGDASTDTPETAADARQGTYANVLGNTDVKIDGGTWLWDRKADTDGNITYWKHASDHFAADARTALNGMLTKDHTADLTKIAALDASMFGTYELGSQTDFFITTHHESKPKNPYFTISHNIYGGGHNACYVGNGEEQGKAVVTLNHSPVSPFKDGETTVNMLDISTVGGYCWYRSINAVEHPQFSAFGGGYGPNTKVRSTEVYAQPGAKYDEKGNLFVLKTEGGTNVTRRYLNQDSDADSYMAFENDIFAFYKDNVQNNKDELMKWYGSSDGTDTDYRVYLRYRASQLAYSTGAPKSTFMDIHGGGYSGYVTGDAKVVTDHELACRNVFGGGLGSLPLTGISENLTYGEVGGNTDVRVLAGNVSLNIFGGGAGVESAYIDSEGKVSSSSTAGATLTDFPHIARVKGRANVDVYGETVNRTFDDGRTGGYGVERTLIFGGIYGGGDVANVGTDASTASAKLDTTTVDNQFTTSVRVWGASTLSQIYAGGNGRLASECADYTRLGSVYGNTRFKVQWATNKYPYEGVGNEGKGTLPPFIWNRIYGGCNKGTVYGNTFVDLESGYIAYNVFGGGWGNVSTVNGNTSITSADVTGNTHVFLNGAEAKLSSLWIAESRTWTAANFKGDVQYSPQYDPEKQKFTVNHNVYGGGNQACKVNGETYITMNKGLLKNTTEVLAGQDTKNYNFFETNEWHEVYDKIGSSHFCVYGGGYGENTLINGNTNIDINIPGTNTIETAGTLDKLTNLYKHFFSEQSVMDVIGGGFSGYVKGTANVTIQGNTFLRRVLGGGFYGSVGATNVNIKRVDCGELFGGGLMGDVGYQNTDSLYNSTFDDNGKVTLNIGTDTPGSAIYIHQNVYGGNDVSGDILTGTTLNIHAGHIQGNVYGAGNGNYLYAVGRNKEKTVTVNEDYKVDASTYPLVYTVPSRKFMTSWNASTPAQRMVNCASYRPKVQNVEINLQGKSASDMLTIGGVFGGGNSATVNNITGQKPQVKINFGSNLKIDEVFMGCDGNTMFKDSTAFTPFQRINVLDFNEALDWTIPGNRSIPTQYLPVTLENRPKVYKTLLDLYFQPIEMDVQPVIKWDGDLSTSSEDAISNVTIGSFYCGGNHGNMNVEPDANGEIVNYTFPSQLVITDKIVGGCNAANYRYDPGEGKAVIIHKGGYLLGKRGSDAINLKVECQFDPQFTDGKTRESCNVFGGCYTSGTINGDVHLDVRSDMLAHFTPQNLTAARAADIPVGSVYGAGYQSLAYVRGNTKIDFGKGVKKSDHDGHGATANFIYGGGQQGCLVGNSTIRVYNGHVASSVCGGSYSGLMYGSSQVLVGYPKYYVAKAKGTYNIQRTDKWNADSSFDNTIKKSVSILKGDIVSEEVYDAISSYTGEGRLTSEQLSERFEENVSTPGDGLSWSDIDIKIDEAVYGGGYALASGSSIAAGSNTVKKFDDTENLDEDLSDDLATGETTKHFGGNTTVLVWDAPTTEEGTTDHISISSQDMQVKSLTDGANVFGYYYKDTNGNYRYIYLEDATTSNLKDKFSDAYDTTVYEYNGEGGMYGDGHLSFAEGFRSGELHGYGFAGKTPEHARILNTFQRMDMLRITDCAVQLLGARDYTVNEISTTPYSIARVGEIQMIAENVTNRTSGTLAKSSVARSRNYLGLSNNIHYCGAIYSNVAFSDDYRKANGEIKSALTSYQMEKQSYITNFYKEDGAEGKINAAEFAKRNDGTAANMIGIASGYALKIQNLKTVDNDGATTEEIYYGPVVGVIEMSLVNVREGEGGGYVYAKNIHHRQAPATPQASPRKNAISTDATGVPVTNAGTEDFLETSGNFVFPHDDVNKRYIVDDCFNHGWDSQSTLEVKDDVHYWYVTGTHYYYNTTITGYTYDSSSTPLKFDADNSDALMNLAGTPAGTQVRIKSITWRSAHTSDSGYEDELEERNILRATDDHLYKDYKDASGNNVAGKYKLLIGASSETTYNPNGTSTNPEDDATNGVYFKDIPFQTTTYGDGSAFSPTSGTDCASANIVLQLVDNANNSGVDYYQNHLSEPCKATIELETTVDGTPYYYTIYLTINYVQGPNVTGDLKISNCALPGEMIEIGHGTIKVTADASMAQCATIYRIGPLTDGKLAEYPYSEDHKDGYFTYEVGNPYSAEKGEANTTSEMLKGVVYDDQETTNPVIRVPAYYFMNGYGVQYCFRVVGINETFAVPHVAADIDKYRLLVHNYHRMQPRKVDGTNYEEDLHIDLAAQRASTDSTASEPRIYIEDATDLNRFATFLNEKSDAEAEVGSKYDSGNHMQFILQNDITVPSGYVAPDNFKGIFHGNGHVISGVDKISGKGLFKALDESSDIHNLGVLSGRIVAGSSSENNAHLHCCYEYAYNTVYRINGDAFTGYNDDDWRYGKVAYDLNQYYLRKRYQVGMVNSQNSGDVDFEEESEPSDGHYAPALRRSASGTSGYVEDYYANGDYLYADYSGNGHYYGSEYLRTNQYPNYGNVNTAHNKAHTIDQSRAVDYVAATNDTPASYSGYQPLLDAAKISETVSLTMDKNDYLFFGQILNEDTKQSELGILNTTIPATIASDPTSSAAHLVSDMTNRVYRAGGYYGSKYNNGFYYNTKAYVHDNGITAIDFYGYRSRGYNQSTVVGGHVASALGGGSSFSQSMNFYSPVSDYGMTKISVNDAVTRNLLLYTDKTDGLLDAFRYSKDQSESAIKAHVIDVVDTPATDDAPASVTISKEYLHLVERTSDDKNSEGGACLNNDFNCPVPFTVTERAWYTRVPRYYAKTRNDAWEGVSLPFNVNRVEASFNGEITHFYGVDDIHAANEASANTTSVGHEYWLRGLTGLSGDKAKATFQRPGSEGTNLFTGGTLTGTYTYLNTHFRDVYGALYYDNGFSIYDNIDDENGKERTFADYYYQQAYVPYIASFPGATFKEFDLSGAFNQDLITEHGESLAWDANKDDHNFNSITNLAATKPQNVTFSWYCNDDTYSRDDCNVIAVTDVANTGTSVTGSAHKAAFSALDSSDVYAMNDEGTAFDHSGNVVLPFRTYMTVSASGGAKSLAKPQSILIYEAAGIEELPQDNAVTPSGLRIYTKDRKIYIESPESLTLNLYTAAGQLVRIFDVLPGTNTYSGFTTGIYIINQKKLYVK